MAILVVCTGCKARFQVSDQYAGRKGPCPKCKAVITIPAKSEEVVIHTPQLEAGAKNIKGEWVLKPLKRTDLKFSPIVMGIAAGSTLAAFVLALIIGGASKTSVEKEREIAAPNFSLRTDKGPRKEKYIETKVDVPIFILALGAILLAPPLVWAGYNFLRDDELAAYQDLDLWRRIAICSLAYAALWGLFAIARHSLFAPEPLMIWQMALVLPPIVIGGAVAAYATFDFDIGTSTMHYGIYLVVTVLLRLTMGLGAF